MCVHACVCVCVCVCVVCVCVCVLCVCVGGMVLAVQPLTDLLFTVMSGESRWTSARPIHTDTIVQAVVMSTLVSHHYVQYNTNTQHVQHRHGHTYCTVHD